MLPLRYPGRWQMASVILLFAVLAAALMPFVWFWGDRAGGLRFFANMDKWLHGITFLLLAVWFSGMFARNRYLFIAIGLLLFGLTIEALQFLVGYRTADWYDMAANAAGIVLGLAIGVAGTGGWCAKVESRWSA